jgi:hypothetical protein
MVMFRPSSQPRRRSVVKKDAANRGRGTVAEEYDLRLGLLILQRDRPGKQAEADEGDGQPCHGHLPMPAMLGPKAGLGQRLIRA